MQLLGALGLALASAGLGGAQPPAGTPIAVSPGSDTASRIDQSCPTFSWGGIQGAKSYDLVVYRLDDATGETEPVLRHRVSGSALSWTPSLASCFVRGGRYAWSLRAVNEQAASDWSEPSLFEVTATPNEAELLEAMATVRRYAAAHDVKESDKELANGALADSPSGVAAKPVSAGPSIGPPPAKLRVDGHVDAASFGGDGSGLTALDPSNISPGSAGIDITGNAANVTGTVAIAHGGTGATDAAAARANLDVAEGPHVSGATYSFTDCAWTDYVNQFDLPFDFICPDTKLMRGVSSFHDNNSEDRRFKFYCCALTISLTK